jgi:sugar diacid utilization regulator
MTSKYDANQLWRHNTIEEKVNIVSRQLELELAVIEPSGDVRYKTDALSQSVLSLLRNRRQALLQKKEKSFPGLTLRGLYMKSQSLGWLVLEVDSADLTLEETNFLDELVHHLNFLLWHEQEIRREQRNHREQFLYDLLYHNFETSAEMIKLGKLWNMNLERPHHVVVIDFDHPLPSGQETYFLDELEHDWSRFLASRFAQPITMQLRDQLVILLTDSGQKSSGQGNFVKIIRSMMERIREKNPHLPAFSIGIGRLYPLAADFCRSLQEARQAVSLGRFRQPENAITCYEELGVLKLLSHIRTEELDDFVQETLGPLMEHDEENNTGYLDTLEAYFQENESLPQASERLFIHVNTLRNRLKKIQEILGVELGRAGDRVRFYVACQAIRIIKRTKY